MVKTKAFTLIELLIVVAIIAILAAIAVPNFLEAQTRAKVSRAEADMRSLATAIESYQVDNNVYPPLVAPTSQTFDRSATDPLNGPSVFNPQIRSGISSRFIWVTTPIAYITSVFRDPFIPANVGLALDAIDDTPLPDYDTYDYVDARTLSPESDLLGENQVRGSSVSSGAVWHVVSAGPDRANSFGGGVGQGPNAYNATYNERGVDYDPTNGTLSDGDIVRIGSGPAPAYSGNLPAIDRVKNEYNF